MGAYPEKTIADREKEMVRYTKELESRELALKVNKAGAEIERFKRDRMRSNLISIKSRIIRHNTDVMTLTKGILGSSSYKLTPKRKLLDVESALGNQIVETYNSIKEDIKTSLKDDGNKIEKLFPNKKFNLSDAFSFVNSLLLTQGEYSDILEYLKRYD